MEFLQCRRLAGIFLQSEATPKSFCPSLQWAYELVRQSRRHRDNKHQGNQIKSQEVTYILPSRPPKHGAYDWRGILDAHLCLGQWIFLPCALRQ